MDDVGDEVETDAVHHRLSPGGSSSNKYHCYDCKLAFQSLTELLQHNPLHGGERCLKCSDPITVYFHASTSTISLSNFCPHIPRLLKPTFFYGFLLQAALSFIPVTRRRSCDSTIAGGVSSGTRTRTCTFLPCMWPTSWIGSMTRIRQSSSVRRASPSLSLRRHPEWSSFWSTPTR